MLSFSDGYLGGASIGPGAVTSLRARNVQTQREHNRKILSYEREFNINLSRINAREADLRQSMLAYTEHARRVAAASRVPVLRVHARHIPRAKPLPRLLPPVSEPARGSVRHKLGLDPPPTAPPSSLPHTRAPLHTAPAKKLLAPLSTPEDTPRLPVQASLRTREERPRDDPDMTPRKGPAVRVQLGPGLSVAREQLSVHYASASDLLSLTDRGQSSITGNQRHGIFRPLDTTLPLKTNRNKVKSTPHTEDVDNQDLGPNQQSQAPQMTEAILARDMHTKLLLRDALRSLRACDKRRRRPIRPLYRTSKSKRLRLHTSRLDAIPESTGVVEDDEDTQEAQEDSNPRNKTTPLLYRHGYDMDPSRALDTIIESEVQSPCAKEIISRVRSDSLGRSHKRVSITQLVVPSRLPDPDTEWEDEEDTDEEDRSRRQGMRLPSQSLNVQYSQAIMSRRQTDLRQQRTKSLQLHAKAKAKQSKLRYLKP